MTKWKKMKNQRLEEEGEDEEEEPEAQWIAMQLKIPTQQIGV